MAVGIDLDQPPAAPGSHTRRTKLRRFLPSMASPATDFDTALARRFDRNGPRYTSYPTADRFGPSFDEAAYRRAVAGRITGGVRRPLSLYVHLPFCRDVCFYCACNKIVTRDASKAAAYLDHLDIELA